MKLFSFLLVFWFSRFSPWLVLAGSCFFTRFVYTANLKTWKAMAGFPITSHFTVGLLLYCQACCICQDPGRLTDVDILCWNLVMCWGRGAPSSSTLYYWLWCGERAPAHHQLLQENCNDIRLADCHSQWILIQIHDFDALKWKASEESLHSPLLLQPWNIRNSLRWCASFVAFYDVWIDLPEFTKPGPKPLDQCRFAYSCIFVPFVS